MNQTKRVVMFKELPEAYRAMQGLESYIRQSGLDHRLLELIKIRASQMNGCAFCINMHTKDARNNGEKEQRIYALSAWRDTNYFTPEERAALALTEAVTFISEHHVPDEVYEEAAKYFDSVAIGNIIMAAVTINGWNRIAISTGMMPE